MTVLELASKSLEELQQLTDIEDVKLQLRLLQDEETQAEQHLDELLQGERNLDDHLKTLDDLRYHGFLRKDGTALLNVLSGTSKLADRISGKVRQLDLEQSRVKAIIGLVEDIQDLQKCASGVEKALASGDYELAGHFVGRFLTHDPAVVAGLFTSHESDIDSDSDGTSAKPLAAPAITPLGTLRAAQQTLTDVAMDEFDNAVQAGNEEEILRYFKLFPLVGHHEVGLDKFSAYICGSISRQCQDNMRASSDQPQFYASLLTRLFETIAMIVDRQEAMVNSVYGPGRMLRVIQRLQREADIQGSIILNTFSERRQLKRKLSDISRFDENVRKRISQPPTDNVVEPKEIDGILSELASISQKAQIFDRFLHIRAEAEAAKIQAAGPPRGSDWATSLDGDGDGLVKVSKLDELIQQLMGDYVTMEEYFIRRSVEKAMSIDSSDPSDMTSTCVEDVFYILKTCTRRALATNDSNCISAIVNGIGRILELDYMNVFQNRLSSTFAGVDARDAKGGGQSGFMVCIGSELVLGLASVDVSMSDQIILNNMDVSCAYIAKLTEELHGEVEHLFPPAGEDLQLEKIRSCLAVLSEYADSFRNILKTWIDNIFKQQMKPRIRPLLQTSYQDVRYTVSDEEYAIQDVNEMFVKRFMAGITKIIAPYKKSFSEWNYNHIMICMIEFTTKDWERYIMQTFKFNQLGSLRFDKDLRAVTSFLSSTTQWPSRDRFARLGQIATLLSMERVTEVLELWGGKAGPIAWRLPSSDVRKILALRIDFHPDQIAKLELQ
ncbi:Golgi transport complex subunit 4 [Thoreauomyces humboldtii]|nr:Golgi transport complex subunit 4 [Thoreauomyces humboldtii]